MCLADLSVYICSFANLPRWANQNVTPPGSSPAQNSENGSQVLNENKIADGGRHRILTKIPHYTFQKRKRDRVEEIARNRST